MEAAEILVKNWVSYSVSGPDFVLSEMVQRQDISWIKAYAIAIAFLLSGAAVVHNIFKPDLVRVWGINTHSIAAEYTVFPALTKPWRFDR